jgi:hypothetical protein
MGRAHKIAAKLEILGSQSQTANMVRASFNFFSEKEGRATWAIIRQIYTICALEKKDLNQTAVCVAWRGEMKFFKYSRVWSCC